VAKGALLPKQYAVRWKSWVDTVEAHDNNWLVLVFHGVDGIGWEALPGSLLQEYFSYIKTSRRQIVDCHLW
jgi:hypothetical protein